MTRLPSGVVIASVPQANVSPNGKILIANNSERPADEVQELVHIPSQEFTNGSMVQCTFREVPQVGRTYGVVLSKPAWMWGAEMGTNECSLAIALTIVHTKADKPGEESGLLYNDIVRLALERCKTASEAVTVVSDLITSHPISNHVLATPLPQAPAGACFVMADRKELRVLETTGTLWVAKKLTGDCFVFAGRLMIGADMDRKCTDLEEKAIELGLWTADQGELDFAKVFSRDEGEEKEEERHSKVLQMVEKATAKGSLDVCAMIQLLRDVTLQDGESAASGCKLACSTVASQVSALTSHDDVPSCHWFTATPLPGWSMFKPIIFCEGLCIGSATLSPIGENDNYGSVAKERFQKEANIKREHLLWEEHSKLLRMIDSQPKKANFIRQHMHQLETLCCQDVEELVAAVWGNPSAKGEPGCGDSKMADIGKAASIFEHMIDLELNFLK